MAATVVQSKSGAVNSPVSSTTTATFNTAATAGNLLVLVVAGDDYAASPPSGWTESTGCRQETFLGHYLWWKVAAGGETSVSYTIGSASPSCWLLAEISGLAPAPFDVSAGTLAQSSGTSYTTPPVTPTAGERLLLASVGGSFNSTLSGVDAWQNSFVEIVDAFTTLGGGTRDTTGLGRNAVTANGSTSYSSGATYTGATVQARTGMILAFKVAAAGGATVTGSAALTAQSSLSTSATVQTPAVDVTGSATLAAQSALGLAAKVETAGGASLSGTSAFTAAGSADVRASSSLTGSSSLAASASTSTPAAPQVFGAVSLAGGASLASVGAVDVRGSSTLTAGTTHTASASVDVRASVALSAAGLLSSGSHLAQYASASLSAQSALTARALSGGAVQITPPLSITLVDTRTSAELADTTTKVIT